MIFCKNPVFMKGTFLCGINSVVGLVYFNYLLLNTKKKEMNERKREGC